MTESKHVFRSARADERTLAAAIAALLVAGLLSLILHPQPGEHIAYSRNEGSLQAPFAEGGFTAAMSAPSDPADALGGGSSNGGGVAPSPGAPAPSGPKATPPPENPDNPEEPCGLLCSLPLIPPPPPHGGSR